MSIRKETTMTRADLADLVKAAQARYDAMTPAEKAHHDHEQRRSYVRGMCPSRRDYNEWCEIVDRVIPPLRG
jgi:hypothetical protein